MTNQQTVPEPAAAPRLELLTDLAGVGWFETDAQRNLTAVSPELERITGFDAAEVLGKPCISLIRCRECLRGCGVFRNGRIDDTRLTLYRKDGSEIDVIRSGIALRDDAGEIMGSLETVRLADQAGASPPAQVETLLGSLGRMYIIADGEMRVMSASATLAEAVGLAADAITGLPVAQLLGDKLFGPDSPLRVAIAEGERREGLSAALHAMDGRPLPVSISVGPIAADTHCGDAGARIAIMIRPEDETAGRDEIPSFAGIVGRSASMQRIFRLIDLLHDNDATILVTGESGTGKELVARALHARSSRADGPFVAVNCAALPAELLESELFGHVRGAFTGAVRDRPGRFELADGGTLFLDEIGDLAPALQVKLLRVLQERTFERVGETRPRAVDVRVIAATHIDLARAVSLGQFREDLYYRLRVVPIHVPPLRERRDDLTLLIPHLLRKIGQRRGRALRLAPAAFEALLAWDWPGNVRELENALEYATALCEGQTIHATDLPAGIAIEGPSPEHGFARHAVHETTLDAFALTPGQHAEVQRIRDALERAHYRRDHAAKLLGISRTTLWRKMKEYRI